MENEMRLLSSLLFSFAFFFVDTQTKRQNQRLDFFFGMQKLFDQLENEITTNQSDLPRYLLVVDATNEEKEILTVQGIRTHQGQVILFELVTPYLFVTSWKGSWTLITYYLFKMLKHQRFLLTEITAPRIVVDDLDDKVGFSLWKV